MRPSTIITLTIPSLLLSAPPTSASITVDRAERIVEATPTNRTSTTALGLYTALRDETWFLGGTGSLYVESDQSSDIDDLTTPTDSIWGTGTVLSILDTDDDPLTNVTSNLAFFEFTVAQPTTVSLAYPVRADASAGATTDALIATETLAGTSIFREEVAGGFGFSGDTSGTSELRLTPGAYQFFASAGLVNDFTGGTFIDETVRARFDFTLSIVPTPGPLTLLIPAATLITRRRR